MRTATILAATLGGVLAGLTLITCQVREDHAAPAASAISSENVAADVHPGFLYGRVTTDAGDTYGGRLRWGRTQEAFWGDYFNGTKSGNPWVAQLPSQAAERPPMKIFGFELPGGKQNEVARLFMTRFGDIARIEALGFTVRVTLKSGTTFDLARGESNDFDDGVRVWDPSRGVVDLESWAGAVPPPAQKRIRIIEFAPTARPGAASDRLHGTVRTTQSEFTGFVQWDREAGLGDDTLIGESDNGEVRLLFKTIRSIARRASDSCVVTLLDGREIVLSGARAAGDGNRGIYVDDVRFGRVLISPDAFVRLDFSPGGGGPAYTEFPAGRPLRGRVTTRDGRRLAGRLVYDLDESEITETLDAPSHGVDYTIPFGLIGSVVPAGGAARASVTLHTGVKLQLERAGDLGEGNAGVLIFVDGADRPEYVRWADVERIDFERPPAMYPPWPGAEG